MTFLLQDWGSVDPEKFFINANGGRKFNLADNIELGNYNMLLVDCVLWKPGPNEESQDMFKNALPEGFAWELIEITSGKLADVVLYIFLYKILLL